MSQTAEFSIVLGGPLYRLYRRVGIAGESLELAARRATAVALFCWLPLLLLALYERNAWGAYGKHSCSTWTFMLGCSWRCRYRSERSATFTRA
jgi:hypothetical protein